MKKIYAFILMTGIVLSSFAQTSFKVFDKVPFFDGYKPLVTTPPPPAGVIRHKNNINAVMLTDAQLALIGSTLHMNVTIYAACDNYDRIGDVHLAFVHKDSTTYNPDSVKRIEVARYITPFMNKNISPTAVPYEYDINNIAFILKDTGITNHYNIWVELEVFGVSSSAQTQVAGCAGRLDVFYGSVTFTTNAAIPTQNNNVLIPVSMKKKFNNYQATGTDTLGKTTRTFDVNVPVDLTDAAYFLITSNHGANTGGEEYNRRFHYVYIDGVLKLTYKPGRQTCEPFRTYNTQANGIYGSTPKTDAQWQSFSNWCPGDKIDIRRINLGALSAGLHQFKIAVPDALFTGAQGNFPLSIYLHGKTSGKLDSAQVIIIPPPPVDTTVYEVKVYPNPVQDYLTVEAKDAQTLLLIDPLGHVIYRNEHPMNKTTIYTRNYAHGVYILQIKTLEKTTFRKVLML